MASTITFLMVSAEYWCPCIVHFKKYLLITYISHLEGENVTVIVSQNPNLKYTSRTI